MIQFLENVQNIFLSLLKQAGLAWWVEIVTYNPCYTYYFGPFTTAKEAKSYQSGYIEDLEQEEAEIISVEIKQGQPKELTIGREDLPEQFDSRLSPTISRFTGVNHH